MRDARDAAAYLRRRLGTERPKVAVVLGSGLGGIAESLVGAQTIGLEEVPGFPETTVTGHSGRVHLGRWGALPVLIYQGRVHLYEGHPVETVTLAVRAAAELGVERLILTNAAGSCHRRIPPGSLMRAVDLLDLFFRRLRGSKPKPFLGRGGLLDGDLGERIDSAAISESILLRHGILCGSTGPNYETAAEVRMWRKIGGHAACMSTIPEAWAAGDLGIATGVVSLITNYGTGIAATRLDHAEVVAWAARAGRDLERLLRRTVESLDS